MVRRKKRGEGGLGLPRLGYLFTLEQRRRKYASHSLHCRTSSLLSSLAIPAHFPTTISFNKPSSSSPAPPRSRPRRTPPFSQLPGHHIAINEGESSSKGANWGFASGCHSTTPFPLPFRRFRLQSERVLKICTISQTNLTYYITAVCGGVTDRKAQKLLAKAGAPIKMGGAEEYTSE